MRGFPVERLEEDQMVVGWEAEVQGNSASHMMGLAVAPMGFAQATHRRDHRRHGPRAPTAQVLFPLLAQLALVVE